MCAIVFVGCGAGPDEGQRSYLSGVTAVAAGFSHSVSLKDDGTVYIWGNQVYDEFGNRKRSGMTVKVSGLAGVIAIECGMGFTVALKNDGTVWTWGYDWGSSKRDHDGMPTGQGLTQVPGLTGITAVAASGCTAHALRNDGTVWSWGSNFGCLGDGTEAKRSTTPVQVVGSGGNGHLADIIAIAPQAALRSDGTVWTWGASNGPIPLRTAPVQMVGPAGKDYLARIKAIAESMALRDDGTVWAWGLFNLGDGTKTPSPTTPVQVVGPGGQGHLADIIAIDKCMALKSNGTVWTWGSNRFGQLGNYTREANQESLVPVQVTGLDDVRAIASGAYHKMALTNDGTVWTWGENGDWQLGREAYTILGRGKPGRVVGPKTP